MIEFQGSGNFRLVGCANVTVTRLFPSKFLVGEVACVLSKAQMGIIEKIAIKKVKLNLTRYNQPVFVYQDTLNSIYNQDDLCRLFEAQREIESYREYVKGLIKQISACGAQNIVDYFGSNGSYSVKFASKLAPEIRSKIYNIILALDKVNAKEDILKEIESILLEGGSP